MNAKASLRCVLAALVLLVAHSSPVTAQAPRLTRPGVVLPRLEVPPAVPEPVAKPNLRIDRVWIFPDIYRDNEGPDIMAQWVIRGVGHRLCFNIANTGPGESSRFAVGRANHGSQPPPLFEVTSLASGATLTRCAAFGGPGSGFDRPEFHEEHFAFKVDYKRDPDAPWVSSGSPGLVDETDETDNMAFIDVRMWGHPDLIRLCQGGSIEWYRPSHWGPSAPFASLYRCAFGDRSSWDCNPNDNTCEFHEGLLTPTSPSIRPGLVISPPG